MVSARFLCSALLLAGLAASSLAVGQPADTVTAAIQTSEENRVPVKASATPKDRMKRWGLTEDPGLDPDPNKLFDRDGNKYVIHKFDLKRAEFDVRPGWVRPRADLNFEKEIYHEEGDFIWVWSLAVTSGDALKISETNPIIKLTEQDLRQYDELRKEYRVIEIPDAPVTLRFEESSVGLPVEGSWRNSLDIADMNGDGHLDIVAPAQRGTISDAPAIFLGDGKGGWSLWKEAEFLRSTNYGSVSVADLNNDGNPDIVCGIHLFGIVAFLSDGKGKFVDSSAGLPTDFATRRVRTADFDKDGDIDIAALTEGPTPRQTMGDVSAAKLRIYLNQGKGTQWKLLPVAEDGRELGGDWMSLGDFNNDKRPDIVTSSIFYNGPDVLWLNSGAAKFKAFGRGLVPWFSIYTAVATGRVSSTTQDDAVLAFGRFWPGVDPNRVPPPQIKEIVGIERVSWKGGKAVRTPIVQWQSRRPIWGLASADFDGDKKVDLVYWDSLTRRDEILMGDGKGNFRRAKAEGLELPPNTAYDITVADVNRDGKPDILMMFESQEKGKKDGSIRVWLNRSGTMSAAGR